MGKGASTSQANQQTNTSSADSRIVNESGIVARDSALDLSSTTNYSSWDGSTTTTNLTNIQNSLDPEVAKAAFNFASNVDATSGQGLTNMLSFANELTGKSIGSSNSLAELFGKQSSSLAGDSMDSMAALAGKSIDSATSLATLFGQQSSNQASKFQDNVLQAYDSARTTTTGGIDNKTMIILGVAAAGALAYAASKKG